MRLTDDQVAFYMDNGFLQIDNFLSEEEIETLLSELPNTIEENSPRVILEDNGSIRSIFAPHFVNDTYEKLSRLERFIIPSQQLIGSEVYLHQYKINSKKALRGEWWEWHQDFPYWHHDDGIVKPDMISAMLYLQEANAANGSLMVIPKTHKLGIVKFALKENLEKTNDYASSLNSNIKFTVDHNLLKEIAIQNTIVTTAGKKGTVVFFHGNIFHASNVNLTPFDRDAVIITYNSTGNTPERTAQIRPEFLAGRKFDAIKQLEKTI